MKTNKFKKMVQVDQELIIPFFYRMDIDELGEYNVLSTNKIIYSDYTDPSSRYIMRTVSSESFALHLSYFGGGDYIILEAQDLAYAKAHYEQLKTKIIGDLTND